MDTAQLTTGVSATAPASSTPLVLRASAISVLVATLVNLVVYGLGRLTDASFVVSPALGPPDLEVGAIKVALTTLVYVAPGVVLLAVAARRSVRWVSVVAVVAAVFAVVSALGPLDAAHDQATGWALVSMHLTTGAVFVLAALWIRHRLTT